MGGNYGQINLVETGDSKKVDIYHGKKPMEQHSTEQFEALIKSFEENGYDSGKPIDSDKFLLSINGSHRLTLAYHYGIEFINTKVYRVMRTRRFSLRWFWGMGFSELDISRIREKMQIILDECHKRTGEFYCILFPPTEPFFDEITDALRNFDPSNIHVIGFDDHEMQEQDFKGFLSICYSFDSIKEENFQRKLYYILRASDVNGGMLKCRIVRMNIKDPMYRLKSDNGLPESMATVRMKESIRERFKGYDPKYTERFVGDYAHDVIIHSTDNFISNKGFRILLSLDKNLEDLFRRLAVFDIALVESSNDKASREFPRNFLFHEDIDILARQEDLDEIVDITEEFCINQFVVEPKAEGWIAVEAVKSDNGKRVWVKIRGTMIIMFDYIVQMPPLKGVYIRNLLEEKKCAGGWRPEPGGEG